MSPKGERQASGLSSLGRREMLKGLGFGGFMGAFGSGLPEVAGRALAESSEIPPAVAGSGQGKRRRERVGTDVLVVGGGPSGLGAAVGAARQGAKVIVIEEDAVMGGAATDMGVLRLDSKPETLQGVHREVRNRMTEVYPQARNYPYQFPPWVFAYAYQMMVRKEKNASLWLRTPALAAVVGKGQAGRPQVKGVIVQRQDMKGITEVEIEAKVVLDCSGDGDVAADAGCEFRYGREAISEEEPHAIEKADRRVQLCTLMCTLGNSKHPAPDGRPDWAANNPNDPSSDVWRCCWAVTGYCEDTTNEMELHRIHSAFFETMLTHRLPSLQKKDPGVYLKTVPPKVGVRESRRIVGAHILTERDLTEGRIPDDTLVTLTRGFDAWGEHDRLRQRLRVKRYGIPYRSLVPIGVDGILVAGRCISGTHIAMSAYRTQTPVTYIGQAAGVAAALACQHNTQPRNLDPKEIQKAIQHPRQGMNLDI